MSPVAVSTPYQGERILRGIPLMRGFSILSKVYTTVQALSAPLAGFVEKFLDGVGVDQKDLAILRDDSRLPTTAVLLQEGERISFKVRQVIVFTAKRVWKPVDIAQPMFPTYPVEPDR